MRRLCLPATHGAGKRNGFARTLMPALLRAAERMARYKRPFNGEAFSDLQDAVSTRGIGGAQ
jgi:hypothetical protein